MTNYPSALPDYIPNDIPTCCREQFADQSELNRRFDRIMDELAEQRKKSDKRWKENNQKWEKTQRKSDEQWKAWEKNGRKSSKNPTKNGKNMAKYTNV